MSFFKKDGSQLRRDPTGGYRYVGDLTQGSALTGVCVGTGPAPPALRSPNNLTGAQGALTWQAEQVGTVLARLE
jgi:alkylated DNA repair dioxygenase AlkB